MPDNLSAASLDELRDELASLRATVQEARRERLHLTARTPSRAPLLQAAVRAQQDRDSQISPELTELRKVLGDRIQQLRDRWASEDRRRWILRRIDQTRISATLTLSPHKRAAFEQVIESESEQRSRVRDRLSPFGIAVPNITPLLNERAGVADGKR